VGGKGIVLAKLPLDVVEIVGIVDDSTGFEDPSEDPG